MSVEFVCHNCGRELKVHERAIGRRVRCPECETLVVVPNPEDLKAGEQESEELPAEPSPVEEEVEEPAAEKLAPAAVQKRMGTSLRLRSVLPTWKPSMPSPLSCTSRITRSGRTASAVLTAPSLSDAVWTT